MTQTIYDIAVITAIFAAGMLVGYLLKVVIMNNDNIKKINNRL